MARLWSLPWPGAGKTTAMTYRIERLVREGVFPARAILATSFSKASVRDIKDGPGPLAALRGACRCRPCTRSAGGC